MKKKKKKGLTKIEKFLYKSCLVIIALLISGIVFTSATVSKMNIELQKMNSEVEKQEDTNQSLAMKINEMSSLEKDVQKTLDDTIANIDKFGSAKEKEIMEV